RQLTCPPLERATPAADGAGDTHQNLFSFAGILASFKLKIFSTMNGSHRIPPPPSLGSGGRVACRRAGRPARWTQRARTSRPPDLAMPTGAAASRPLWKARRQPLQF